MKNWRNTLAIILVIIFGSALFYVGTDGFRAFTAESARTYELLKDKPVFPDVTLQDSQERTYSFDEFAEGKIVFLTFMYTSCTTVCPQLEMNMADVYEAIPKKYIGKDILFLSISFDPERDNPETLAKYQTYFGSDGETWRMARINDKKELDSLLKRLGVIVIPDGNGNFTHNTAFYLIGKQGHLMEILDYTKIEDAADTVIAMLGNETGG
ncbi:redoxin domain-containing protein [Virgibacillus dakarensis]|uniref:SCO family protein n=1 Tax=Virgibacillus dakarensis TaxID=1917889 RepID=UPI000B43DD72|nr:SCO family protein [Virgibacillus dakarensis]MTW85468.1 redoxin domain-containing protein [Virgibacillus dakarensis]